MIIEPFKHQQMVLNTLYPPYHDITYTFMIGGFGCGKSTTGVYYILQLLALYKGTHINIGVGGVSLKLLRETLLKDLFQCLDRAGIAYKHNSQSGIISVGTITIIYLNMSDPDNIFAHNFNIFIGDELDEIEASRVKTINIAVQERTRRVLPAVPSNPSRDPPIIYLTTAQGMKGTYTLIESFKESKIDYIKVRGRTQDNLSLSRKQLANLRSLYTPEEARAFLDGEFVNLAVGRVYAEFDPSKNGHIQVECQPMDVIYCGQDFNPGFNANVQCVVRTGHIYVISEDHYNVVGDAPRLLRRKYPTNPIIMTIDVSGKEILQGFWEEFEKHHIEVIFNSVNPLIAERILAVNKMCRLGLMHVTPACKRLLLGLNTRDFDDKGAPAKGKGPEAIDHHCDSFEYAVWHIIHTLGGFGSILKLLRGKTYNEPEFADAG